jgi:hypothetical protein
MKPVIRLIYPRTPVLYAVNEWENVRHYLNDGNLDIDNNSIENAVRPFAVERKNWPFSISTRGAKASANLYSLIETANANGIRSFKYLKHVFTEMPAAQTVEQIEQLLPTHVAQSNTLSRDVH